MTFLCTKEHWNCINLSWNRQLNFNKLCFMLWIEFLTLWYTQASYISYKVFIIYVLVGLVLVRVWIKYPAWAFNFQRPILGEQASYIIFVEILYPGVTSFQATMYVLCLQWRHLFSAVGNI